MRKPSCARGSGREDSRADPTAWASPGNSRGDGILSNAGASDPPPACHHSSGKPILYPARRLRVRSAERRIPMGSGQLQPGWLLFLPRSSPGSIHGREDRCRTGETASQRRRHTACTPHLHRMEHPSGPKVPPSRSERGESNSLRHSVNSLTAFADEKSFPRPVVAIFTDPRSPCFAPHPAGACPGSSSSRCSDSSPGQRPVRQRWRGAASTRLRHRCEHLFHPAASSVHRERGQSGASPLLDQAKIACFLQTSGPPISHEQAAASCRIASIVSIGDIRLLPCLHRDSHRPSFSLSRSRSSRRSRRVSSWKRTPVAAASPPEEPPTELHRGQFQALAPVDGPPLHPAGSRRPCARRRPPRSSSRRSCLPTPAASRRSPCHRPTRGASRPESPAPSTNPPTPARASADRHRPPAGGSPPGSSPVARAPADRSGPGPSDGGPDPRSRTSPAEDRRGNSGPTCGTPSVSAPARRPGRPGTAPPAGPSAGPSPPDSGAGVSWTTRASTGGPCLDRHSPPLPGQTRSFPAEPPSSIREGSRPTTDAFKERISSIGKNGRRPCSPGSRGPLHRQGHQVAFGTRDR